MNTHFGCLSLLLASTLVVTTELYAQAPKVDFPAASPACTLKQHVGLTDIEIVYSRPSMKHRTIYGGLVPYGQVWRTGANEATTLVTSADIVVGGGAHVPAGSYTIFTVPTRTSGRSLSARELASGARIIRVRTRIWCAWT